MRNNKVKTRKVLIAAENFWKTLKIRGYDFFAGIPCSMLSAVLRAASKDPRIEYIPAVRENAALGVASGAYLAGRKSGILIQNSGLGNIVNALTSFNLIYNIPVLIFITWRGFDAKDAPEHMIMGRKTLSLLKELGIPYRVIGDSLECDVEWAIRTMEKRSIPVAIIIKDGQIE